MSSEYTVLENQHGIAVFGPVPLDAMERLANGWGDEAIFGFGVQALLRSRRGRNATMVICRSAEAQAAWIAALEKEEVRFDTEAHPVLQWLAGARLGLSALTAAWALHEEQRSQIREMMGKIAGTCWLAPSDFHDFDRVMAMAEAAGCEGRMASVASELREAGKLYAAARWEPVCEVWGELVDAWRRDSEKVDVNAKSEVYAMLRALP